MEQIAKKVTVEGDVIVDLSSTTLLAAEAKYGKWFYNADGYLTQGTYIEPEIDTNNEFTAGTNQITKNPAPGKQFSSVTINPTPTEEKEIVPTIAAASVQPTSGHFLSKVTVKPLQTKTINNFLKNQTVIADEGYCGLYSVSITGAQKEFEAINAIIGEGI